MFFWVVRKKETAVMVNRLVYGQFFLVAECSETRPWFGALLFRLSAYEILQINNFRFLIKFSIK